MDCWDLVLMAIVGSIAVIGLVRLMNHRRSQLADELMDEAAQQRRRQLSSSDPPKK